MRSVTKTEYDERRIWWQDEVDRQIKEQGSDWERIWYWRGIQLQGLEPERKRAIVAAVEHAIERAVQGVDA